MGGGPKNARIMVIGEAPGEREDDEATAFVGPSGRLLRNTLQEVGLEPDHLYITNAVKCRPPDNRSPSKAEVRTCSDDFLRAELEAVDPDYILTVGNVPLQALTNHSGITKYRGTWQGNVFPVFHPAYVLRSPQHEPTFRADLERFARDVRGEATPAEPSKVKVVRTEATLNGLLALLRRAPVVAFDFETNDRGSKFPRDERYYAPWEQDAAIVCLSVSVEEGTSYVVPLWHDQSPWRKKWVKILQRFREVLCREDVKIIAHNGKFDCKWAWQFGVPVRMTFDTMLAAHVLDENRLKGLKPLSQLFLGADAYDIELVDTHTIPLKKLAMYAGKDTDYTLRLYNIFKDQFKDDMRLARVFSRLMMPGSHSLTAVELGGMYLDPANHSNQLKAIAKAKAKSDKAFRKYVPSAKRESLNLNSPQQLAQFFFGDLKLNILKKTKTGAASTDESVMLRLAKQHPAPALLLEYRKLKGNLEKLTSWDQKQDERSRVHTNYKLFGTVTGRLSSEKPNLQQVPREGPMRTCFGAPNGWRFVEADYSQVELRIAAMLSRDPTLLRIFATGGDPHLATACEISGLTPGQVTASDSTGKTEHRKKAKPVNFGFLYGMGEQKFIDYAFDNYGIEVSAEESHEYRTKYFRLYAALPAWHERQRRLARRYKRVVSPIGRVRNLPTIDSSEKSVRGDAERQAINSPVQSLASDTMLASLNMLYGLLPMNRSRIVGTVHDAILFEVREDYVEELLPVVQDVMQNRALKWMSKQFGVEWSVPIEVEIKVGQHWGAGTVWHKQP